MVTGIESINKRALMNREEKFSALMHHFSEENLRDCFESLDGTKAIGVDGVSKQEYGERLEENLKALVESLKRHSYHPKAVKRVEILKEDGTTRPLGISCTEDKIIQEMSRRILEAIYEPIFLETSYGFRPGRDCHDALKRLDYEIMNKPVNLVVDMDISKFFDTIPHDEILKILSERISDRRFLRLIARLLKVGIQLPEEIMYSELGSPQGSVVSPVIANVYLDKVLDKWFEEVLKPYFTGYCEIIRYADDTIAVFEKEEEAAKFMKVLPLRLAKFGLKLNAEKTKIINFGKQEANRRKGRKMPTFDFLGFTHYWGKSRNGKLRVKRKTSKKRLRRAIVTINQWIKQNRNRQELKEIWKTVVKKIQGHYNYYGISDNMPSLRRFSHETRKSLYKWLNRRSQKRSFTWNGFIRYVEAHPLPLPKIRVSMFKAFVKN